MQTCTYVFSQSSEEFWIMIIEILSYSQLQIREC